MSTSINFLNAVKGISVNTLNKNYEYTYFNLIHQQNMHILYGVNIELDKSILDYIADEKSNAKTKRDLDKVLAGKTFVLNKEFNISDTHKIFFEITYTPTYDQENNVGGIGIFGKEIGEKSNADIEMLQNERLLQSINTNIRDGIYRSTHDKGIIYVNKALINMFGYDNKEEFLAVDGSKLYKNPDLRQRLAEIALEKEEIRDVEVEFVKKDGSTFWGLMSGLVVHENNNDVYFDGVIRDISLIKETEEKLKIQQQMLESINQNISEAIYRSNQAGLLYANNAFIKMFGYDSLNDLLSTEVPNFYNHHHKRQELIGKLNEFGSFFNEEVEFLRKDGSVFYGLISSSIQYDADNKPYWDGAIRDITKQKLDAIEVAEKEQLLQSIGDNINEAIYRSVNAKGLIYINKAFVSMFGYDNKEEILESDAINLYKYKEDRRRLGDMLVEKGKSVNEEVEFRRKDGSTFWGAMNAIKVIGADGETYFDGAIRDITLQKESEIALKKNAEMQHLLLNISSKYINLPLEWVDDALNKSLEEIGKFVNADRSYIFEVDLNKNTQSCTHEWCAEGISPEIENCQNMALSDIPEFVIKRMNAKEFIINDVMELPEGAMKEILISQQIQSLIVVPMIYLDEWIGYLGFDSVRNKRAFSSDETNILHLFANMLVSIKSRVEKQQEFDHLLLTTTNQNKRLKDFSFMTSHNIRSSVANLLGLTNLLQFEPENKDYLNMLNESAENLDNTINNISALLNFENEFFLKENQKCNLQEVFERILALTNQIIEEKNAEIIIHIEPNIIINTVTAYIDSIFHNLVTNALKYGVTDESKIIEINTSADAENIHIHVKDYGLGIDLNKYRDKIFKFGSRFHLANSKGEGMGLFMTKNQVEALGGKIEVNSEVGRYTVFTVSLPIN